MQSDSIFSKIQNAYVVFGRKIKHITEFFLHQQKITKYTLVSYR